MLTRRPLLEAVGARQSDRNPGVDGGTGRGRVLVVDLARSAALAGMIVFHLVRDLEMFGLVAPGTTLAGGWAVFARVIAASFLFLVGVSLVLAHREGFRSRRWARRFAIVTGAALLVTLATYAAVPSRFVYFGILHAIAASSVLSLPFLFAPAWVAGISAAVVVGLAAWVGRGLFATPWLAWTGLSSEVPAALDFIPLAPWLAACLAGVAVAKAVPMPDIELPAGVGRALAWPGRHSLAIYLLHQPVLVAAVWSLTQVAAYLGAFYVF